MPSNSQLISHIQRRRGWTLTYHQTTALTWVLNLCQHCQPARLCRHLDTRVVFAIHNWCRANPTSLSDSGRLTVSGWGHFFSDAPVRVMLKDTTVKVSELVPRKGVPIVECQNERKLAPICSTSTRNSTQSRWLEARCLRCTQSRDRQSSHHVSGCSAGRRHPHRRPVRSVNDPGPRADSLTPCSREEEWETQATSFPRRQRCRACANTR